MKRLLPKLTSRLQQHRYQGAELTVSRPKLEVPREQHGIITQSYFWPRVGRFFKRNDVIVAETGA